jgi:hypothetical protein
VPESMRRAVGDIDAATPTDFNTTLIEERTN